MTWLLLVLFPTVTFAITVDSPEQCMELAQMSAQIPQVAPLMVCAKTYAV